MIVNQIDEAIERLKLGRSVEDAKALKTDLDVLYEKLKNKEIIIKSYLEEALETQDALEMPIEKKKYLINSLKRFENDAIEGSRELAIQDLADIDSNLNDGKNELRTVWSAYRSENYSASAKLIEALLHIMKNDARLDELGELRLSIEERSIGNKQTVEDISSFRKLTEELIKSLKMEPDIQDFVKKLAQGENVLLSELSSEIYTWVRENKLDKRITLSMSVR